MDITYYEQMLAKHYRGSDDMEAAWDARAEQFNRAQQQEMPIFPEQVKNVLKKKGLLTNASVLDIGGGSGRYALPLAKEAHHVTVTDISSNMLKLAQQNAEAQQLQNLSYCKLEWETANLSQLKWEQAFDLCFVSMCPAIRSPIGFRNLSAACKGYCVVNQFIRDTDLLSDYLNTELNIQPSFQPHNDREIVQAIFNLLWLDKKNLKLFICINRISSP